MLNFETLSTDLNSFESELTALKKTYSEKIMKQFSDILRGYFEEDTECKVITWTQYTPYFNDGEECVFRVNDPAFYSSEEALEEYEYDGDLTAPSSYYDELKLYDSTRKAWRPAEGLEINRGKLSKIIGSDSLADILKLTFGDHVKVTVRPDGITSEEYDHD